MSKKQFKSQASSGRAPFGASTGGSTAFGSPAVFGATSSLSYIADPPDLSAVSDPHVVVAFKNLSKKDSTTKAKALDDLQAYIEGLGGDGAGIEDAILEAWIKTYARTSIDTSRRVRQLAHTFHGQLAVSSGKRLARYMPKAVGAWLAGLYDNDRSVARAAQAAFDKVFSTAEKKCSVWRVYERPILGFVQDAVVRETAQTLSDERSVSPDDADAKYARVVATGLCVLLNLLESEINAVTKEREAFYDLLCDGHVWHFASHKDAFVRRSVYRLLRPCISKQPELSSTILDTLSTEIISKSLHVDQSGSAWDLSESLSLLTKTFPTVWTDSYAAKKAAALRLRQLLRRGSQGGPAEVWTNLAAIVHQLPSEALPHNLAEASELLESMQEGINNKDESRANVLAAWQSYVEVSLHAVVLLSEEDQARLLMQRLFPILQHHLRPALETATWAADPHGQRICVLALEKLGRLGRGNITKSMEEEWTRLADLLVEDMQTSSPQQSRDFEKSQGTLAVKGSKWASLGRGLLDGRPSPLAEAISRTSLSVTAEATAVLAARKGKPYGAAAILKSLLQEIPTTILRSETGSQLLSTFFSRDFPTLWQSPSLPMLCSCLSLFGACPENGACFREAFVVTTHAILSEPESTEQLRAAESIIRSLTPETERHLTLDPELERFVVSTFERAMRGLDQGWALINAALRYGTTVVSSDTIDRILSQMTNGLAIETEAAAALRGLDSIAESNSSLLNDPKKSNSHLLSRLLSLTESADEDLATHAEATNASIESILSQHHKVTLNASFREIIIQGLTEPGPGSVSVQSLVERAQSLLENSNDRSDLATQLLPTSEQWQAALKPFLAITPDSSLAITDILGGSLYMVSGAQPESVQRMPRDPSSYSAALRIAMYVARLLKSKEAGSVLDTAQRSRVLRDLLLTVQLANDNIGVPGSNNLWLELGGLSVIEEDVLDFVFDAQGIIRDWVQEEAIGAADSNAAFVATTRQQLEEKARGQLAPAFYNARALAYITEEQVERDGCPRVVSDAWAESLAGIRKNKSDLFIATSFLTGFGGPMSATRAPNRLCNELVSDLTGLEYCKDAQEALRLLVLLNSIIQSQETLSEIPQQRLIPLVKRLMGWGKETLSGSVPAVAEVARLVTAAVPLIQDVYGSHWAQMMAFVSRIWLGRNGRDSVLAELPAIHASLKLFAALMRVHDANDDLDDAWRETMFSKHIIGLLKIMPDDISDDSHSPLKIVNTLLSRQIGALSPDVQDRSELYGLLYNESSSIQQTAFGLLHRLIPAAQEEISLEAALSKSDVRLPEELLSAILEAPTLASLVDTSWERSMPMSLRGYLFGWILVFDHFTSSSYKVRSDYIANLREGGYLGALLDFTFDFLGHDRGKPVDAARFDVVSYVPGTEESEKDAQWLLIHLYYLSLKHLPSMAKAWWIDCPGRHKVSRIESWTEKFISPLVIADELATVDEWVSKSSERDAEDESFKVKVSKKAKEVTAGYDVDEQTMQIVIKLPGAYPLRQATVEGINRVGVDEKKWRSWLINTQGVITFSNGSLVDGLTAWRKNVSGAMKGQTECAICYSIISADKQLPSKRCGTCKNLFHSSCLFRWFKSSNSSSCPLCRNPFNYG